MARDSQAALVALNRFGFGARGGASGDFINAASTATKAVDLARVNSDPALAAQIKSLVDVYERGKPFRDVLLALPPSPAQAPPERRPRCWE